MLIYLTKSLLVPKGDIEYNHIWTAVRNIAISAAESKHLMLGDEEALRGFRIWFEHDPQLCPLFNKLISDCIFGIPDFITYYIEVVNGNPLEIRHEGNRDIVQLTYKYFNNTNQVQSTSLIIEDKNDFDFFNYIAKWYINKESLNCNYNFTEIDGGGANTYIKIEREIESRHLNITIVDTDCKYPNQVINDQSTYGQCRRVTGDNKIFKLLPLKVHEIENLIPSNILDSLPIWTSVDLCKNKRYYDYLKTKSEEILPYFDIKKGIMESEITDNDEYKDFAKKCYSQNPELQACSTCFEDYLENHLETKNNGKKIVYRGLMESILKKVLCYLKDNQATVELFEYQEKCWDEIGENMINWGIARNDEVLSYNIAY